MQINLTDFLNFIVIPAIGLVIWILKRMTVKIDESSNTMIRIDTQLITMKRDVEKAIEIGDEMREKSAEIVILQRDLKTAFKLLDENRLDVIALNEKCAKQYNDIIKFQSELCNIKHMGLK